MADKKNVNPGAAGAAGAVIGLAVGAAAVALSDKNNRKKVQKTMSDMKVWGDKKLKNIKSQVDSTQKDMSKRTDELKKDLLQDEDSTKKTSSSGTSRPTTQA